MILGPVFRTEMVTTARRSRYFFARVIFGLLLLVCLWACYEGTVQQRDGSLTIPQAARLASDFFQVFAWVTLLGALLATPAMVAGAVATERERRTIEYLFATDLSNAEIILSKLTSRLLLVGKLALVALPILAIFRLLGGIPWNTLVIYFAGLASTVCLLAAISICISVWTPRARDAVMRVYLVVALVMFMPILLGVPFVLTAFAGAGNSWLERMAAQLLGAFVAINPLFVLGSAISLSAGAGIDAYAIGKMVAAHLGLSAALVTLAVVAVRRVHLRAVSSPGSAVRKPRRWSLPHYRPPIGQWPMIWKELFARTSTTRLGLLGRLALAAIVVLTLTSFLIGYVSAISWNRNSPNSPGDSLVWGTTVITGGFGSGIVLLAGLRAAGLFANEKERDCWISLLSTPLTGSEIVWAKALGNLYAFRWLLAPLGLTWLLQTTLSPTYLLAIPLQLWAIGVTTLFATGVGLCFSLKFESSIKAIGATVGAMLFIGGGYMGCCCMPLMLAAGVHDESAMLMLIGCIPVLQAVPGPLTVLDWGSGSDEVAYFAIDYLVGTVGYAVAAIAILLSLASNFDFLAGRTSLGFVPHRPAPPPSPAVPPPAA